MAQLDKKLKAFVRYDGSGRVVPSSLILRKNKPKVGKWKEITANECGNFGGNQYVICMSPDDVSSSFNGILTYTSPIDNSVQTITLGGNNFVSATCVTICAKKDSVVVDEVNSSNLGPYSVVLEGVCGCTPPSAPVVFSTEGRILCTAYQNTSESENVEIGAVIDCAGNYIENFRIEPGSTQCLAQIITEPSGGTIRIVGSGECA